MHVHPPSPCLAFALVSPDATISQFQSTQGWWDLTLFFAHQLRTSEKKEEGRRDEHGCFFQALCSTNFTPRSCNPCQGTATWALRGGGAGRTRESAKKKEDLGDGGGRCACVHACRCTARCSCLQSGFQPPNFQGCCYFFGERCRLSASHASLVFACLRWMLMSICVFHVTEYGWCLMMLGLAFRIQKDALPLCGLR